jgi:tripartite-type tricarboxylate transporter receptor subunit TctC
MGAEAAMRRRTLMPAAAALALAGLPAHAADWAPSRPVTFLVPLAAGGTADIMARVLAEQWVPRLGQPVLVDNRPAAGGLVGTEALRQAAPDGHTIGLISQGTLVFNTFLRRTPPFDALRDFTLIAPLAIVTNALVVHRGSRFRSVGDVIAAAKAAPGRLTYSSGGNGTSHHIAMVLLSQLAGIELTHVPYRGAPAGITAAMTGEVDMACYNIPTVIGQIRAGDLRPLAVTSAARSDFLPEVPSLNETGIAGYELTTWVGLGAPARLPLPMVARYAAEARRALGTEAVWAALRLQGFERMPALDPEAFGAFLAEDMAKWGPVIRASGAAAD